MRYPVRFLVLAIACGLAGCAAVQSGADRAGRTVDRIGDSLEEKAQAAGRKTRSLWNRLFGTPSSSARKPGSKPAPSRTSTTSPASPAEFDTYAEERVGS